MQSDLPPLRCITQSQLRDLGDLPRLVIKTDDDVEKWKNTRTYHEYDLFLRRLNESVVGTLQSYLTETTTPSVTQTLAMLDTLEGWTDDIPPLNSPQRFGNLAFRTWGARLDERADSLLEQLVGPNLKVLVPYIKPYLLDSFGSFTRMDYGTGHETSFGLLLLSLTLVRFFNPIPEEERQIVLNVFVRYLRLCWKLQDVYRLEPAGSHGVWGLDDYSFLPYIFGSGQLRDQSTITPSSILHPPLPPSNLYFLAIMRIHDVKRGPFFEHSSQLYSIATGVPNWGKVNSGLFKMYRVSVKAEVLGKRVVVQHIPLGGLLEWESPALDSASVVSTTPRTRHPTAVDAMPTKYPNPSFRSIHPAVPAWTTPMPAQSQQPARLNVTTVTEPIPAPVDYVRKPATSSIPKCDNVGDE